ncbi:sphingomyelin phosphodiesterase-like [Trichogramma pretiosum]|uniref:sphingomyelin phosphodiesterase-like n=1 Tax=Trichogramma pretiosum TaxID=7493 RepID=UPI000C71B673|nr:sphingomyelin phosphodiesterase-like [Trichogramma pretiosum]
MNYDQWISDMKNAFEHGNYSKWASSVNKQMNVEEMVQEVNDLYKSSASCIGCKFLVNMARIMMQKGKSNDQILDIGTKICNVFKIQTPRVCEGVMKIIGVDVVDVVRHSNLKGSQICRFFLGQPCVNGYAAQHDWNITIFPAKEPKIRHPLTKPSEKVPPLKILQISDTHFDPLYEVGSNADCGEPLCCRASSGTPNSTKSAAGKWGDYRKCDTPLILLENAIKHIVKTHKDIDAIYWTGDLPPHDVWVQTREDNIANLKFTSKLMAKYFKGIPIFPSVGNHESVPVDGFAPPHAPPHKNMSWLYDQLAVEWSRWLPTKTHETIRKGAFYSTLLKKGFRVISVNGNYCSRMNFYLLWNSTDPLDQLAWLSKELQSAEDKGEKVHIIGHIPPGGKECLKSWSSSYYDIINRYEGTIMAQFFGHTHWDEFEIFYDLENLKRPVNIGYIAPSITPWENVNPAYRIYYVEGDHPKTNRAIIDHETWKINLDEANRNDNPVWYKAYSAKKAYNMKALSPKDWDDLLTRMDSNDELFDTFYMNHYRNSPVRPNCNNDCRKEILCNLRSARSESRTDFCS